MNIHNIDLKNKGFLDQIRNHVLNIYLFSYYIDWIKGFKKVYIINAKYKKFAVKSKKYQ